jgi:hypothetical protein
MLEFLDSNGIVGVQSELQKAEFLLRLEVFGGMVLYSIPADPLS